MKKSKATFYPQKIGGVLFITGCVGYLLFGLIRKEFDEQGLFQELAWLSPFGAAVAGTSAIIFGIRAIRYYGFSKERVIAPVFGIFLYLSFSFSGFFSGYAMNTGLDIMFENNVKIEQLLHDESISNKRKVLVSKLYAQAQYYDKGKLVEYLTGGGKFKTFKPTKGDEDIFYKVQKIRDMSIELFWWGFVWLGVLGVSLLFSFLTPVAE